MTWDLAILGLLAWHSVLLLLILRAVFSVVRVIAAPTTSLTSSQEKELLDTWTNARGETVEKCRRYKPTASSVRVNKVRRREQEEAKK